MSVVQQTLLIVVLIPGAVALAITVAGRRCAAETAKRQLAVAAAVFAAQLGGSWGLLGRPELVPIDISRWVIHVGAIGLLAAIAAMLLRDRPALRWAAAVVAALAVSYVVLRPVLALRWPGLGTPVALAIGGATALAYRLTLERVRTLGGPRSGASAVLVSIVATAVAVGASGSVLVAQLGGAAVAGLGAVWLMTLIRPASIAAAVPVAAATGWAMVAIGYIYAAMPLRVAIATLVVPLVGLGALEFARRVFPRGAAIALIVVTLAAAALATTLAASPATTTTDADYGYE